MALDMNLILTMAGTYERFKKEGFSIPKYFLPWADKNILSEILYNFLKDKNAIDFLLILMNKDDSKFISHVRLILKAFDFKNYKILEIDNTSGQAETASIGVKFLNNDQSKSNDPILIHNIDTILYGRNFNDIKPILEIEDGYVDIFQSSNHSYSYVIKDNDNYLKDIVEKVLVSESASSGLYGFKNSFIFLDFYNHNNKYISEIYHNMVLRQKRIRCSNLNDEENTLVLGTPEEYFSKSKILLT